MKQQREDIVFLIEDADRPIGNGSVVDVFGQKYTVKHIVSVALLDEAVTEKPTVKITARAVKCLTIQL